LTVTATVDRTALAEGFHSAMLSITSDAMLGRPTVTVGVDVQVGGETLGDVGSVFVLVLDGDTFETIEQTETDASQHYAYMLPPLAPGTYLILASTDRDGNGVICESEDACGIFPDEVTVVAGQEISGIDFIVSDLISPQRLPSAFRDLRGVLFNRLE
jgi:hypothetical protein